MSSMNKSKFKQEKKHSRAVIPKEWLYKLYIDQKMSLDDIAKQSKASICKIYSYLHRYNIPIRSVSDSHNTERAKEKKAKSGNFRVNRKLWVDKDELYYHYVTLNKTDSEIAAVLFVHPCQITLLRRKYGIPNHPLSEASRKRLSLVSKGHHRHSERQMEIIKDRVGAKNPMWLGGLSYEPYTQSFNKQLKELIRIRDGYVCQLCGTPERELVKKLCCHHIDYNKKNNNPTNLISLCNECHLRTNYSREHWQSYFIDVLNKRQINPNAMVKGKIKKEEFQKLLVSICAQEK